MKIIKLGLSLLAVLSLAVLVITQNLVAAGVLFAVAVVRIAMMFHENPKRNAENRQNEH